MEFQFSCGFDTFNVRVFLKSIHFHMVPHQLLIFILRSIAVYAVASCIDCNKRMENFKLVFRKKSNENEETGSEFHIHYMPYRPIIKLMVHNVCAHRSIVASFRVDYIVLRSAQFAK